MCDLGRSREEAGPASYRELGKEGCPHENNKRQLRQLWGRGASSAPAGDSFREPSVPLREACSKLRSRTEERIQDKAQRHSSGQVTLSCPEVNRDDPR